VAFEALARERSVTGAAHTIGVTQSALSHALRRLRALLGDPLLVRGQSGMVLTQRAESLVLPVQIGLNTLRRALSQPAGFAPYTARRAFSLATPDLFDVIVVPALLERLRREAPGVDLTLVVADPRRLSSQLETGEVDAAILPQVAEVEIDQPPLTSVGFVRRELFRDQHACFVRRDHPVLCAGATAKRAKSAAAPSGKLSLEAYAGLSHLLVSPRGAGPGIVDQMLAQRGLTRRVALRVPHFYAALSIVSECDLILTAPSTLGLLVPLPGKPSRVVVLPPPLRLPSHSVHLVWHERFGHDAGHSWLRDLIAQVARATRKPPAR
jgi:DNA-binding transcriptional LysR family regulator